MNETKSSARGSGSLGATVGRRYRRSSIAVTKDRLADLIDARRDELENTDIRALEDALDVLRRLEYDA